MNAPHVEVKPVIEQETGAVSIEIWLNQRRTLTLPVDAAVTLNLDLASAINRGVSMSTAWVDRQIAREDYDGGPTAAGHGAGF